MTIHVIWQNEIIDSEKFTVPQLKEVLSYDSTGSWKRWTGKIPTEKTSMETVEAAAHRYNTEKRDKTQTDDEEWQQATARNWLAQEARREEMALRDRELEILKRELMQRELTLLRQEANVGQTHK